MIGFLTHILKRKKIYIFHPNLKIDIIIFGKINTNFSLQKKIKFFELNDQVYISTLLKALLIFTFNLKNNLKDIYFKEVIKKFSPKIAIGDEINNNVFKFKKYFPNKIAIGFQIVNRSNITTNKIIDKKYCDYFLLFNQKSKRYYRNIKAKFFIIGSLKNNEKPLKNRKKIFDIMFISEYRPNVFERIKAQNSVQLKIFKGIKKNFYYFNEKILEIINEIVNENKFKFSIALASNRIEKKKSNFQDKEVNFFTKKINNFNIYNENSYSLAQKSELIISMWSTLGAELYAQRKKVLFIAPPFHKNIYWDFFPKKNGINWQQNLNKKEIKKKILKILNFKNQQWENYCKSSKYGMFFDPNNQILKKIIFKELNAIRKRKN